MNLLTVLDFFQLAPDPAQDVSRLDDHQLDQLRSELEHKLEEARNEIARRGYFGEYSILSEMESCPF